MHKNLARGVFKKVVQDKKADAEETNSFEQSDFLVLSEAF